MLERNAGRAGNVQKVTSLVGEASAKRNGPGVKPKGASPPNVASRLAICRRVILDISPLMRPLSVMRPLAAC